MDPAELFETGGFWRQHSPTDTLLFVGAIVFVLLGLWLLKWWSDRRAALREAREFLDYTRKAGFTAEEYEFAADLVNDHHVVPAMRLLLSLRHFDAIATAHIQALLGRKDVEPREVRRQIQRFYAIRSKLAAALGHEQTADAGRSPRRRRRQASVTV